MPAPAGQGQRVAVSGLLQAHRLAVPDNQLCGTTHGLHFCASLPASQVAGGARAHAWVADADVFDVVRATVPKILLDDVFTVSHHARA